MKKHDSDLLDALIRRAGFDVLKDLADEMPPKDEAKAFFSDITDFDLKMQKVFKKEKAKRRMRKVGRVALRVAVVIVAIIIISGIAIMSSEALRVKFLNLFKATNQTSTDIQIPEDEQEEMQLNNDKTMYIPDGFELVESTDMGSVQIFKYEDSKGSTFRIERSDHTTQITVDNERFDYDEISIAGQTAYAFEDEERSALLFYSDDYTYFVYSNISIDELIKIAESIL